MELKSGTVVFLLFFLLSLPYLSRGGLEVADSEIYEIDYRGPETHTSIVPPPGHSRRRQPSIHHDSAVASHRARGSPVEKNGENAKEVHG